MKKVDFVDNSMDEFDVQVAEYLYFEKGRKPNEIANLFDVSESKVRCILKESSKNITNSRSYELPRTDTIKGGYIPVEYNYYKELVNKAKMYDASIPKILDKPIIDQGVWPIKRDYIPYDKSKKIDPSLKKYRPAERALRILIKSHLNKEIFPDERRSIKAIFDTLEEAYGFYRVVYDVRDLLEDMISFAYKAKTVGDGRYCLDLIEKMHLRCTGGWYRESEEDIYFGISDLLDKDAEDKEDHDIVIRNSYYKELLDKAKKYDQLTSRLMGYIRKLGGEPDADVQTGTLNKE